MRYRPLQAFHAVISTGTVTAAADKLGISQPAISNLLAQLEHKTKLKLFRREKGRLIATPEANILYREVDVVVRSLNQVNLAVADLQNQRSGTLQVGSTHALSYGFMTRLLSDFICQHPDVDISFQTRYSLNIQQWVASGLNEIGISELPILVDSLNVDQMQFLCKLAIPEDSPLANLETVTPEDLDNIPFIVLGEDHLTYHRTKELFLRSGSRWRIKCQTYLFRSLLEFVKNGVGVALIDPFTLKEDDGRGYVVRPFTPNVHMDMALIRRKSMSLSTLGELFYEKLRQEMQILAENP